MLSTRSGHLFFFGDWTRIPYTRSNFEIRCDVTYSRLCQLLVFLFFILFYFFCQIVIFVLYKSKLPVPHYNTYFRNFNYCKKFKYTLLTLKYGVNLLNAPVSSVLGKIKIHVRFWLRLAVCTHIFPLRYSDTRSTSANYLLRKYKSTRSCCYRM